MYFFLFSFLVFIELLPLPPPPPPSPSSACVYGLRLPSIWCVYCFCCVCVYTLHSITADIEHTAIRETHISRLYKYTHISSDEQSINITHERETPEKITTTNAPAQMVNERTKTKQKTVREKTRKNKYWKRKLKTFVNSIIIDERTMMNIHCMCHRSALAL